MVDSRKVRRYLSIMLQILDHCQLLFSFFLICSAVHIILSKTTWIFRKENISRDKVTCFRSISQNSQENTCARDSFLIKLQTLGLQLYQNEFLAQVFSCEFREISKNTFLKNASGQLLLKVTCLPRIFSNISAMAGKILIGRYSSLEPL